MCGICGIQGSFISDKSIIERMTKTLDHRGPDDQGTFIANNCAFGQTRLAIIDLSDSGHQPMSTNDGRYTIVYNGETYNFDSIKRELKQTGIGFKGHSDTEVILNAWVAWGIDCLKRFDGMFAFAVWDGVRKELILARDRFGIKPLYYYVSGETIIFGSEMKAILASGFVTKEIEWQGLHEYLYYSTTLGETTFYHGIKKLLPGHYLKKNMNGITIAKYASIYDFKGSSNDSFYDSKEQVKLLLEDSIKSHLVSDVPVGLFLSGGIDSSAIAAFASKHYSGKIKTFSAGFDFDDGHNELPMARSVAKYFNTEHQEIHIEGKSLNQTIMKLVQAHDQPFGDAANLPLYLMTEKLKGEIKVILQGDGGDELFAGYHRYNRLALSPLFKMASVGLPLLELINRKKIIAPRNLHWLHSISHSDRSRRMGLIMSQESYDRFPEWIFNDGVKNKLKQTNPFKRYEHFYYKFKDLDDVQRMLYTDCSIILPDLYFEKVDRSTMANSIEIRVPFIDNNLAKYVMSLPSKYKVRMGQKKYLLRSALRGVVSDSILDAPKKGFGVPFQNWLRGPLLNFLKEVLFDPSIKSWGIFDERKVNQCLEEHLFKRRDNGYLLYKLLNLCLWYKCHFSLSKDLS